jgi:hypothetical protein
MFLWVGLMALWTPELKKKERVSGKRRKMAEIGKNERS